MKSVFGLDQNLAAALSYLFGPISGIVVLVMEKKNRFVRFHALQSTLWFLLLMVIGWILGALGSILSIIPLIGRLFTFTIGGASWLVGVISFVSLVILFIKAYSGATSKIPIIGEVAWNQVN